MDKIESTWVEIRLVHEDFDKKTSMAACELENTLDGNKIAIDLKDTDNFKARKGFVKLATDNPPSGSYKVMCMNSAGKVYETGRNDIFQVLNSLDVEVVSVDVKKSNESHSVKMVVNLNQPNEASIDEVFCFHRKAKNLRGSLFLNARLLRNISTVDCGEFSPSGGGVYQFGVLLSQSKAGFRSPQLQVLEQVLTTGGPVTKRGFFKKNGDIAIKFNTNIQGVRKDCSGIFQSTQVFGKDPECVGKANILEIKLGSNHEVVNGTQVSLAVGNGVQELKAEGSFAVEATGSVTIMAKSQDLTKPEFTLTGPSEICPNSPVKIEIGHMKGFGRGKKTITWELNGLSNQEATVNKAKNKAKLVLSPEDLENVSTFNVAVEARNFLDQKADKKNLTLKMISSSALSVQIRGPAVISADKNLKLKVKTQLCGQSKNDSKLLKYRYFWSADGPVGDLSQQSFKNLKLESGSLQGGRSYNFSVVVVSEQDNVTGSGWTMVTVKNKGPKAKLAANKVTYGTLSNIVLDATLSEDRDNSPGELEFDWSCMMKDGSGCFVYTGANPVRLEEHLPEGFLNKNFVTLESRTLVPGDYVFTVSVSKNNMSSTSSMEIEVIPGSPPTISPIALQSKYKPDEGFTVNGKLLLIVRQLLDICIIFSCDKRSRGHMCPVVVSRGGGLCLC